MGTDVKINHKRELIYLACPYSDPSATVRLQRFQQATKAAAALIRRGYFVFSPITMTHPIDLVLAVDGETLGSDFWVRFDEAFMQLCSRISVVTLPGWQKSSGVAREIAYFAARGVVPEYLRPHDFGVSETEPLFAAAFVT